MPCMRLIISLQAETNEFEMIQQFECPVCRSINTMGNPACISCGEFFSYYCPSCRYIVNRGNNTCPNCSFELKWALPESGNALSDGITQDTEQNISSSDHSHRFHSNDSLRPSGTNRRRILLWTILAVICLTILIAIFFIDRILHLS